MKKILALAMCILLTVNLWGCSGEREIVEAHTHPEDSGPETTQPVRESETAAAPETEPTEETLVESEPAQTQPPETEPPTTEPPTTLPPETQPEDGASVLRAVMENRRQLRAESGSVMYLSEYLATQSGSEVTSWQYLDFDQDGESEVFAITDSPIASYLVIHWNGTYACCFGFGFRSVCELKANGYMSGSNGAANMVYYRIGFSGNSVISYTLADFDSEAMRYVIDGKTVTESEANEFLREWYHIPNVLGTSYYPPEEEEEPMAVCAYCGDTMDAWRIDASTGLCDICSQYVGRCIICGALSANLFEGVCEVCEPYGGMGEPDETTGYCVVCGQWSYDLAGGVCEYCRPSGGEEAMATCVYCGETMEAWRIDASTGLCDICSQYVGRCIICGRLSSGLFEGVCEICEPYGGADPAEFCSVCGKYCGEQEMFEGKCRDCWEQP